MQDAHEQVVEDVGLRAGRAAAVALPVQPDEGIRDRQPLVAVRLGLLVRHRKYGTSRTRSNLGMGVCAKLDANLETGGVGEERRGTWL